MIGFALALVVFWAGDLINSIRNAADIAALQAQAAEDWLGVSDVEIADGINRAGVTTEPVAKWTIEPKRPLELRIAVNTRDIETGEPNCLGGTVTVIVDPSEPTIVSRPLSRIAGVEKCDWPVGDYRSRFTWTMTDPASRVSKTIFQESEPFAVLP